MTRWRAIFTDGTASPFDVVEVPFAGEPSLWRAGEGAGALASSPERAATFWADLLIARCSIDGDHLTGLREIVPPGELSRAEMVAQLDRLRTVADAARAYVEGGEFSCDDVRTETREALVDALDALGRAS